MRKGITWVQLKESKKLIYGKGIRCPNFINADFRIEDRVTVVKKKSLMILNYLRCHKIT